jgi:hypothetical protein
MRLLIATTGFVTSMGTVTGVLAVVVTKLIGSSSLSDLSRERHAVPRVAVGVIRRIGDGTTDGFSQN